MNKCSNQNCTNDASLKCPKCGDLFCSKDCFKQNYAVHDKFKHYNYTGMLRPGIVSPKRIILPSIQKPDYVDSGIYPRVIL